MFVISTKTSAILKVFFHAGKGKACMFVISAVLVLSIQQTFLPASLANRNCYPRRFVGQVKHNEMIASRIVVHHVPFNITYLSGVWKILFYSFFQRSTLSISTSKGQQVKLNGKLASRIVYATRLLTLFKVPLSPYLLHHVSSILT